MIDLPRSRLGRAPTSDPAGAMSPGPSLPPAMAPDPPAQRNKPLRTGLFGVLDVGSSKVCCLIGRVDPDGVPRIEGFGMFASRGVRSGGITDLDEAKHAVLMAVSRAEQMSGHHLRSVVVALSCGQPESRPMNLQWPVGGRPVAELDLKRMLSEARGRAIVDGRETMHVLPLGFEVDETPGVADPRGLHCENLTAHLHIIDTGATAYRNLLTTISRAELDVSELVSAPIAAGLSTLVEDERQLGATVIDMGGGTTDMAVFSEGHVVHTAQLMLGGSHVTRDIAQMLSTPVAHAERLKTLYGNAEGSPDDEREMLPIPLVGEEEHQIHKVPRSQVVGIIRPRLEETFEMVRDKLEQAGLLRESGNRVVLTGGASQLVGAREMAARILDRQVRLGRPTNIRGLPELHDGPAFSTAAGLLAWAAGAGRSLPELDGAEEDDKGFVRRLINFLRDRV